MKEINLENILAESIKNSNSYKKDEFIINAMREVANQCFDLVAENCVQEEDLEGNDMGIVIERKDVLKLKDQVK